MFDILKKKISGFIDGLTKKEESKPEPAPEAAAEKIERKPEPEIEAPEPEPAVEIQKPGITETAQKPEPAKTVKAKPEKAKAETPKPVPEEKPGPEKAKEEKPKPAPAPQKEIPKPVTKETPKETPGPAPKPAIRIGPAKEVPEPVRKEEPARREKEIPKPAPALPKEAPKPAPKIAPKPESRQEPKPELALPQMRPERPKEEKPQVRLSPLKAIKSFITREVEISDSDVRELLENLELELLEGDVEIGVAESIRQELAQKLVGRKVDKGELDSFIRDSIRGTLLDTMTGEKDFDLLELVESKEKPVKIIFLGINGAGKTTTIAKVANLLMKNGRKVVFAAADTFRAAAIEQMEAHAEKLGVRVVKRDYGADPTSVAFDAVAYAKAHGIDAVLIDTAGRQDTNVNLINELKKMSRVIAPDLKIYIGESIAGSSIIEQVSAFQREVGVDGVILTKLDCDPKGGTVLSITKATGIPVIYVGTGQKYEDLERFDARKIVDRMLS